MWHRVDRRLYLQVFVGINEIGTLQPVKQSDWAESRKVMGKWASSEDSGTGIALSAQFLAQTIKVNRMHTMLTLTYTVQAGAHLQRCLGYLQRLCEYPYNRFTSLQSN
jgi:hypothetical protein